jgi:hypothetical protein
MTLLQFLKLMVPDLSEILASASIYVSIALALLTCFFGFRLRRLWYSLLVFALGALLGFAVSKLFLPDKLWLCLLIGLGVGLLAAGFTFRIYKAVVFVLAFCCVFALVGEVLGDVQPVLAVIAGVVLGILAGILAAKFQYYVIVILTAVTGGWQAASGLRRVIPSMTPQFMLILAAVLIAAGLIVQFVTTKKLAKK